MPTSTVTRRRRERSICELSLGTLDEFSHRIIAIDRGVAERWGRLGVPDPIPAVDGLIAATALERTLSLYPETTSTFRGLACVI